MLQRYTYPAPPPHNLCVLLEEVEFSADRLVNVYWCCILLDKSVIHRGRKQIILRLLGVL